MVNRVAPTRTPTSDEWQRYCEVSKDRMTYLREQMQDLVSAARTAKIAGKLTEHARLHACADKLLLDYINNGYITRLFHELEDSR